MDCLNSVDNWQAPQAAVGVLGDRGRQVLAVRGDCGRRSRWASVTKPATALATLIAVEEGSIDLDEPAGPPGATIRHLLAHASGLAFADQRALAQPGRRRIFSNTGYEVLAAAVTVAFPGLAGVLPGFGRQAPMDWGLGFDLKDEKSRHWTGTRNSVGTFGHFGGSGSFIWVDPAAALACVALSGRDFGDWAAEWWPVLADAVIDRFGPAADIAGRGGR